MTAEIRPIRLAITSIKTPLRHVSQISSIGWLPMLGLMLGIFIAVLVSAHYELTASLLLAVVVSFTYAMIAVPWIRKIALDEPAGSPMNYLPNNPNVQAAGLLVFVLNLLQLLLNQLGLSAGLELLTIQADSTLVISSSAASYYLIIYVLVMVIGIRLAPLMVMASTGAPLNLAEAWWLGRNQTLALAMTAIATSLGSAAVISPMFLILSALSPVLQGNSTLLASGIMAGVSLMLALYLLAVSACLLAHVDEALRGSSTTGNGEDDEDEVV